MKGVRGIDVAVEPLDVLGADGTRLQAWVCGTGPHRWLLPPGLGTPVLCWKRLFEHFASRMTVVTWDPRGCHGSAPPADPRRVEVADHVEDACAVAAAVGWGEADFLTGGWSMAVQIGLELAVRLPERVRGLALLAGTFEHVLETAFQLPGSGPMLRATARGLAAAGPLLDPVARRLARRRGLLRLLRRLGIVAVEDDHFANVLEVFADLRLETCLPMILALDRHSARGLLPEVRVPTLVLAGGADRMTPLAVNRELASAVRAAELAVVPRGTHYTTLEFPEDVHRRLERFFAERVWPETWARHSCAGGPQPASTVPSSNTHRR